MFKKSLLVFGLLLCCNSVYAKCEMQTFTYIAQFFDEYIGPNIQTKSSVIICNKNNCADGEKIYLPDSHYIGDGNRALAKLVKKQNSFYNCKYGSGNDPLWESINATDLPVCESVDGLEKITTIQTEAGHLYGIKHMANKYKNTVYYTKVCVATKTDPKERALEEYKEEVNFECEPGKYYVDTSVEDPVKLYKCGEDKKLADSDRYMDRCFDINDANPSLSAPEGFSAYGNKTNYRAYLNKDKITPVTGYENIYQWSSDITSMCWWCNSGEGWFATVTKNGEENIVDCKKNEEEAWCLYAKNQKGEDVAWDAQDGVCRCNKRDEVWQNHTCEKDPFVPDEPDAIDGFECTADRDGEKYVFVKGSILFESARMCDYTAFKSWSTADTIGMCYSFDKWTSINMPMPSGFKYYVGEYYNFYVKDEIEPVQDGVYEYNPDTSKMCNWCAPSKYVFFESDDPELLKASCTDNKQEAECFYAKLKEGKKVDWDYENEKCIGEGMENASGVSDEVVSTEDFKAAKSTVDKFFENAESKASGLKDATGKVNVKRIASDVTAGVVLGTVGGVVSGVVIKKKQIEKGFEVLHCAVGGQSVANWGDTFTVGLAK